MSALRMLYMAARNNGAGQTPPGLPVGQPPGCVGTTPPPPQQAAPPDDPPVDEGSGGGGGGGWSVYFPHIPPMPPNFNSAPFTLLATTVSPVMTPMYAMCMVGGWNHPGIHPYHYCCPPPVALAIYIYPIQYIEIQTRQYYRPPGPFLTIPTEKADIPDHCPAYYRSLKWKANLPVQERYPMFMVFDQVWAFDSLSLPGCRWMLVTSDAMGILHNYPAKLIHDSIEALKTFFLTHNRGAPENIQMLYEQSALPGVTPMVCLTNNWNVHWNPYFGPPFNPTGYGMDDESEGDEEIE